MRLETDAKAFRRLDMIMGLVCSAFALIAIWTVSGWGCRLLICCVLMTASAWHTCGTVMASRRDGSISIADARAVVNGKKGED